MNTNVTRDGAVSARSPFAYKTYSIIWTATLVSNIGGWMYSAASGWLMTTFTSDPLMVSLVQVASNLPLFLFALPAGAIADIVDRRRLLLCIEISIVLVSFVFAGLVSLHAVTPAVLLLFVFLMESGTAAGAPAWQAIVADLVPPRVLPRAIALSSVGVNLSRAVGPALGGVLTAARGLAAPFYVNAVSNLAVGCALIWWRPPGVRSRLPTERFASAVRTGLRHARHNRHLHATLVRASAFFFFASCYWALLPLVARGPLGGGAKLYGTLLGLIGLSAITGAFALPWLKAHLGPDRVVATGSVITALALVLFGASHEVFSAVIAALLAGSSWIAVLADLNVSAQVALPAWVRARGLAIYVTVFFGGMTAGSVVWGQIAKLSGLPLAHLIAALGIALAIPATWRWKLQAGAALDLTPSMHWPAPIVSGTVDGDSGPVLVTVEYEIESTHRERFLRAMARLSNERGRDGAYAWGIFQDTSNRNRYLETFQLESWLEHLRQHARVTNADRLLQDQIHRYLKRQPVATHYVWPQQQAEPTAGR